MSKNKFDIYEMGTDCRNEEYDFIFFHFLFDFRSVDT